MQYRLTAQVQRYHYISELLPRQSDYTNVVDITPLTSASVAHLFSRGNPITVMTAITNEVQTLPGRKYLPHSKIIQSTKYSTRLLTHIPSSQMLPLQTSATYLSGTGIWLPKALVRLLFPLRCLHYLHRDRDPQTHHRQRGDRHPLQARMDGHIVYGQARGRGIRRIRYKDHKVHRKKAICEVWRRMVWRPRTGFN